VVGFETQEVERKALSILKVLSDSQEPLGARVIARQLKQLMAGCRKFALNYINRSDLLALTREAADVSGIPYVMEADMEEAEAIWG
jgi:repressor of nif and glnA expression